MIPPSLSASLALLLGWSVVLGVANGASADTPKSLRVYVGTYTGPDKGEGIYLFDFDLASGTLKPLGLVAKTTNPSFLALSPDGKTLYACGEVGEFKGKKSGMVSAFSVDPAGGKLTTLNQQPSGGQGPCHVSVDATGKAVFAANYGGGSVCSIPVVEGGKLGETASVIQHAGKGTNPERQAGPHAHGIWPSPDNRFVLACDLGLDQVLVYKLDAATAKLAPHDPPFGRVPDGAGARHAAFSPDGKFLYVINEMGNSMTSFSWDASSGTLKSVQTVTTLPDGFKGTSHCAEVVVHPTGRFVYGSNRGHDSIAVFTRDEATGQLTPAGHTPIGGKWPRNFNVDPTGQWLIAAGEHSGTLTVFKIDPQTGGLTQTGEMVKVPAPACVLFTPAGEGAKRD